VQILNHISADLHAEQASARESHATIKGMSISMTTSICSCSDLFIWCEIIWARCLAAVLCN